MALRSRFNRLLVTLVGATLAGASFGQSISNGSFENPAITSSVLSSLTTPEWLFEPSAGGAAGTTANGSPYMSSSPSTTYGTRVMFLQGAGYARHSLFASTPSTCTAKFVAQQRTGNADPTGISLRLELDSSLVWSGNPPAGGFTNYTTVGFSVSAGAHYLSFHSLNPSGTDNTYFIDAVGVSCTPTIARTLGNGDFEAPSLPGTYQYSPASATWTFASGAGISSDGTAFTSANPNAPNGTQVAFLQNAGYMTQSTTIVAGTYTIRFKAAQRASNSGMQLLRVLVDGNLVGYYRPAGTSYLTYQTSPFDIATTGSHTIRIEGAGNGGSDYTAFVDDVQIQAAGTFYGFADQGFTTAKWRTNYDSPTYGQTTVSYGACIFPNSTYTDPAPCPTSPLSWANSYSFSLNLSSFSENKFWVLINNNEPAYNPCNTSAPDISQPRYAPGTGGPFASAPIMDTAAGENFYRAHLVMNFNYGNPCGAASGTPYMSIGAHTNRGNKSVGGTAYNLAALNPTAGVPHSVGFTTKIFSYASPTAVAHRLTLVATWPNANGVNIPRMIQVNFLHAGIDDSKTIPGPNYGPGKMPWNWPLIANTFYPGAEVAYFDADDVQTLCGFDVQSIPLAASNDVHYDVDINELYRCASKLFPQTPNPARRGFSNPMPSTANIPVTVIDWAVEGQSASGNIWAAISNMVTH